MEWKEYQAQKKKDRIAQNVIWGIAVFTILACMGLVWAISKFGNNRPTVDMSDIP